MVPWAALPGTAGKTFWVENLAICAVQDVAASQPAKASESAARDSSILIVGGVEYGPLSDAWEALPGTLVEANLVADLFRSRTWDSGKAQLLSGNIASKSAVLRDLQSVTAAHLATHGFYLKQDTNNAFGLTTATTMLNSGLILAPPGTNESANQQLTAAEIREYKLDNLQLVVLSACETGMGKIKAGQGVDGLASSFHAAGVDCVVSSRWKVPDTETSQLMSRFYQALWFENMPPAKALRAAQMHMLQAPDLDDEARNPVSWAAFTTSYASPSVQADSR
jgi:CHAT domain-containing protein